MAEFRDAATRVACLANWPDAEAMAYDPHCCRFPKSCSIPSDPKQQEDERLRASWNAGYVQARSDAEITSHRLAVGDQQRREQVARWLAERDMNGSRQSWHEDADALLSLLSVPVEKS